MEKRFNPGFQATEYLELLQLSHQQNIGLYPEEEDSTSSFSIPKPERYQKVYSSAESVLFNQWDLWIDKDSTTATICIRGTVMESASWIENFFAGMLPATGSIKTDKETHFKYQLARDDRAAIHAGWLIGLSAIAPTVLQQIKKYYKEGIKHFLIFGHSQGGAIAYLLRSYLHYLSKEKLPSDIQYKTYCSAAPKPGNVYYAYDFNDITSGGYGIKIVNTQDWVPQTPITIQRLEDFNEVNPFVHFKTALKEQPLLVRYYGSHLKNKLTRSIHKANRMIRRILGKVAYKILHRFLPKLPKPQLVKDTNYYPAGHPTVLFPYKGYHEDYTFDGKSLFIHHGLAPYYQLTLAHYSED